MAFGVFCHYRCFSLCVFFGSSMPLSLFLLVPIDSSSQDRFGFPMVVITTLHTHFPIYFFCLFILAFSLCRLWRRTIFPTLVRRPNRRKPTG